MKKTASSVELEGSTPRKAGRYWSVQVTGVGKPRFKDWRSVLDGSIVAKQVRIIQHPPGTGFNARPVPCSAVPIVEESRGAVEVDASVKAIASLSNGAQDDPIAISDR